MKKMINRLRIQVTVLFVSIVIHIGSVQASAGLVLPVERTTGLGCIPEGKTVHYECTVTDEAMSSTIWFVGNEVCDIILRHATAFKGRTNKCIHFNVSAMALYSVGTNYTSRLTLTADIALNGTSIDCTVGGRATNKTDVIAVGVPPLPPGPLLVTFSSNSFLMVSWSSPINRINVNGYQFLVTGKDCGCESMNVSVSTTSVSCSGWISNGQSCSFIVKTISQDCGFTSALVNQTISLNVPQTPSKLLVLPVYIRNGSALHIDVQFTAVDEPSIGANISNTVIYTVMIGSLSFTEAQCNTNSQQCTLRVNGSQLTEDGPLNVSVVASNAVGNRGPAYFSTLVATNIVTQEIASVTIDVLQSTVTCNLLPSYQQTPNATCSITYGPSPNNCSLMYNSTSAIPNSSSILHLIELDVDEYCYTVKLNHGSTVLSITGTFRSECDPQLLETDPSPQEGSSVTVPNGVINYNCSTPGSVATLVCNEGYSVANEINRTCMSDGHWSDETLECIKDPAAASEACGIAIGVSVFGVMLILIVFCVIMALYLCKYKKIVCAGNVKVIDGEVAIIIQNVNPSSNEAEYSNEAESESTFTPENDSAPCDKPCTIQTSVHVKREVTLKPQVEMYADPINLVSHSDGKDTSKRQVEMYADPDDIIPTPQLPLRNYEEGEHVNVPVQDTGQSKLVEEATKPNSSQLPQELYSEVFNALPKGMAPKVVRNGPKN